MIVSWNWLKDYVDVDASAEVVVERLMMAGLNHEETKPAADDLAIDLEITSNRADCLGHIGIAREISVLFDRPLKLPSCKPAENGPPIAGQTKVTIDSPEMCPRYTARIIRGVRVGPSPAWLVRRLETLGIAAINNIVDITNYVLMEFGQPLHAFDLAKLAGPEIIVRSARAGETFEAINHKTYTLASGMCVIADARVPVALGGVMGGASTEVSSATTDLLIESAEFDPQSIRSTARKLSLHSDSSYRFERGVDPCGVDQASRRCCELILELAGGTLAAGCIDAGRTPPPREVVKLRWSQLRRVLGIEVPRETARRIIVALGNVEQSTNDEAIVVTPPSWRRDLSREIDLVEEVARVYGYHHIPEDVRVPMTPAARRDTDRVLAKVRRALTGHGFDEAMTASAVPHEWSAAISPWTDEPPLRCATPVLRRADEMRRSLVPSLLDVRRENESLGNLDADLFEIAKVYWPRAGKLPQEEVMLTLATARGFFVAKGAIESALAELDPKATLEVAPSALDFFASGRGCELKINGQRLGFIGELSAEAAKTFELRSAVTVAEVRLQPLADLAKLIPRYARASSYPAIDRDLNLVVGEEVFWSELQQTVHGVAGPHLESLTFQETYRNAKDPQLAGRKSLLFGLRFRSAEGTLTSAEVDAIRDRIVDACRQKHAAELRA